ncbi:HD domain-containing protein [Schlesneria sp. T3-172]|uniref:HD domain-containing protein n=1 Tax=Schlesneria sphaerica TaxID=3373610 RepID=UPI0037CBE69E
MSDKVFRDPLYNYIAFDRNRDGWLVDLANCREVQRLRRIHQLGVSNFTYPGADHTRFAHSLGVTHLMKLVLEHLERVSDAERIRKARQALLATALLHDVGHGPFSHLFEPCLGINHEQWSMAVILDQGSQVHEILKREDAYLPNHVADLINSQDTKHPAWQRALMSSQLDVDRLDYLRRDSLFTGAGYGHFDWHRLLTTMQFHDDETDLVWPAKSAMAIEEYIFARYYMYQNVYLHKTTRGFEVLLQAMWKRADELRKNGINVNANPVLEQFWKSEDPNHETMPVSDYLAVEEFTVLEQIQRWTGHSDKSLADCARRFLNRDGLAMVEPPPPVNPLKSNDFGKWEADLHLLLKAKDYEEPSMYCLADTVKGKYRQPYREEKDPVNQSAVNTIRVLVDERPVAIGAYLPRLGAVITPQEDRVYYYVPKEIRQEAIELRRKLMSSNSDTEFGN